MEYTAEKIRKRRIEKGWSVEELAQKTGQSAMTVRNHESGKKIPRSKQSIYKRVFESNSNADQLKEGGATYQPDAIVLNANLINDSDDMGKMVRFLIRNHDQMMDDPLFNLYVEFIKSEVIKKGSKDRMNEAKNQANDKDGH